jgi:hypothetical protein
MAKWLKDEKKSGGQDGREEAACPTIWLTFCGGVGRVCSRKRRRTFEVGLPSARVNEDKAERDVMSKCGLGYKVTKPAQCKASIRLVHGAGASVARAA